MTDPGRIDAAALKASVDIVEYIGSRIVLRKAGKDYVGLCPFHDDKHPSLSVVPAKQMFYCPACDVGGDVIAFIQRIDLCNFHEAVAKLGGAGPATDRESAAQGQWCAPANRRGNTATPWRRTAPDGQCRCLVVLSGRIRCASFLYRPVQ